ncbi:hypothetical protein Tco_0766105 [Tanacetum coccineum]
MDTVGGGGREEEGGYLYLVVVRDVKRVAGLECDIALWSSVGNRYSRGVVGWLGWASCVEDAGHSFDCVGWRGWDIPGIPDKMCDVPFRDNSPPLDISKDQFEGFSDSKDDSTSIDDDHSLIDDIDEVEASPPDPELVSDRVVEDFSARKDGEIEVNILH